MCRKITHNQLKPSHYAGGGEEKKNSLYDRQPYFCLFPDIIRFSHAAPFRKSGKRIDKVIRDRKIGPGSHNDTDFIWPDYTIREKTNFQNRNFSAHLYPEKSIASVNTREFLEKNSNNYPLPGIIEQAFRKTANFGMSLLSSATLKIAIIPCLSQKKNIDSPIRITFFNANRYLPDLLQGKIPHFNSLHQEQLSPTFR